FLLSSVPKSGTHLLHKLLNGMPDVFMDINDESKKFFLSIGMQKHLKLPNHYERLEKLSQNEFGFGHVVFSKQYASLLKHLGMKHVFIYWDPRDVLVSLSYFIKEQWTDHPLHHPFNSIYSTPKSRILRLMKGAQGQHGFYNIYEPYYRWINHRTTFSLSYESLMLSRDQWLKELVHYLWGNQSFPLPADELVDRMMLNDDPNASKTFRNGEIGGWKKEFDGETKQA